MEERSLSKIKRVVREIADATSSYSKRYVIVMSFEYARLLGLYEYEKYVKYATEEGETIKPYNPEDWIIDNYYNTEIIVRSDYPENGYQLIELTKRDEDAIPFDALP